MDVELDVEGPGIDIIQTTGAFYQARRKAKTRCVRMSAVTGEDDKFIGRDLLVQCCTIRHVLCIQKDLVEAA